MYTTGTFPIELMIEYRPLPRYATDALSLAGISVAVSDPNAISPTQPIHPRNLLPANTIANRDPPGSNPTAAPLARGKSIVSA
jgi:hypothetical protein